MHYITSDIHNNNEKFEALIKKLDLKEEDKLYILGDLFDRSNYNPNPVDIYFNILKLGNKCQVIRGNHEQELAEYIITYFGKKKQKKAKLDSYPYNSFELLRERLTQVDLQNMTKWMLELPLQIALEIDGTKYLLAHAMTSSIHEVYSDEYYLRGDGDLQSFLNHGIEGYISICGHSNPEGNVIWRNYKGNVIICDCGCGFQSGRLGCLCIETGEEIYV